MIMLQLYLFHRLNEITRISDEVVVMRDGQMVGRLAKDEIEEQRLLT